MSDTVPPEAFGKYELLERIASGGMAEVYRARARGVAGFEKILVIKKLAERLASNKEFTELFIDEARIAVQLQHPNIVQVFELDAVDGTYYMAMEYVQGLDLARLLLRSRANGTFPTSLALHVSGEVLKALQFAHTRHDEAGRPLRIVHCDISPQNVLISSAGEVKLTDFGISRASFQARSKHEVVRGKHAYMSPEQVEGKALDARTDLFSLGIVLYETLTGRRLFKARTKEETLDRVRRAEVPSPRAYRADISEDLEWLLLKSLARNPEDRFQSAAEMLDELTTLVGREGHRATNHDLGAFVRDVGEPTDLPSPTAQATRPATPGRTPPPASVVVLSIEASPPPRALANPKITLPELVRAWEGMISAAGGEIWERGDGSVLVAWMAAGGLRETLRKAAHAADGLQKLTLQAGYRLSAGLAPGIARIHADTRRPAFGWELAGPFYLARWMMNLSAHRGRILLTEVGARHVDMRAQLLGRIPIQGSRFINLYELG